MVHFIALFQSAQDADGILDRWLVDHHGLETTLQCGIFLDMLAVLIQRRGTYAVQFASCQHWLQHIGGIHRTFCRACTYQGMQFIDEKDNRAFSAGDFFQDGFQALLELSAIFSSCH